jgi:Questin oxidase-like
LALRTRREVLSAAAAAAIGLSRADAAEHPGKGSRRETGETALDDALRLLQKAEPESTHGLSTHAPMVVEALCALGHEERAVAWVQGYRGPSLRLPPPRAPIPREGWRSALGPREGASSWEEALARWGDWSELFTAEFAEAPWKDVLDLWAQRLAPGLCAAATHGVIRTAHAARALAQRDTMERRAELARGLAYWAAAYQELPARPRAATATATYAEALAKLPLYRGKDGPPPRGNIVSGLREAGTLDGFADARDLVVSPLDVSAALSSLTRTFARAYLRHGTEGRSVATIAFVHAVTGPCALRKMLPFVKPETARAALPYAWQAAAGIYSAYAREGAGASVPEPRLGRDEIAARAVDNGDEHAIKFTEALLMEHSLEPDPVYLAAAEDAIARL